MNPNPKAYRLPTHALPRRYDIEIDARLGREEVYGKVAIQLKIAESRDYIELHARGLTLKNATLQTGGKTWNGSLTQDAEREMASIKFGESIPTGQATLTITWDGKVSEGLEGLYLAQDGPEKCLCTQCEATAARMILPCFDEPVFKAQWAWKVTTSPDVTVLANGPLESAEESQDGKSKTWTFQATRPMSSYLIALVIGGIASTPEQVVNGKPLRVWALTGKEQMGQFALEYTSRLLPWYEDYFGLPYHFGKYDQVAVPGFSAGAMENAGLVLFRQQLLIMNPETASWNAEKRIVGVVAHEFAHMWFGDVVTMRWWDDLWLNESFAEWMSNRVINDLSPEYHIWTDAYGGKAAALSADALESTHPIYSKVETPAQAAELFDAITYEKGSAVMRMIENFLGNEAFRAGLRAYMQEFKESNASGADLWRHLQQSSNQPVGDIVGSWINQGGYPVVSISVEKSGSGAVLKAGQKRFFSTPDVTNGAGQLWQVPLVVRYEDETGVQETHFLLSEREQSFPLDLKGELKWAYANSDEIGFYRQNLDAGLLKSLLSNLDKLEPIEQMGLLGDQWALVRNGTQTISAFLDVLSAMMPVRNYSVQERVDNYLHSIEDLLERAGDEQALANFRNWVSNAYKERLDELGFEPNPGESQNETQSRVVVLDIMTTLAENPGAIKEAEKYADKEAADPASVDPNLGGLFVGVAAKFGDRARMDRFVKIYEERRAAGLAPQETNRYLDSLPVFEAKGLPEHVLELVDEKVVPQEAVGPFLRQMLAARHSQLQAWDYLKLHWKRLTATLGEMWPSFLVAASGQLPAEKRADMVAFYDADLNGLAEMSYRRALETLDQLAEFRARTKPDLVAWFKRQ